MTGESLVAVIGAVVAIVGTALSLNQWWRNKKAGAKGTIVEEVESRREYTVGVYRDRDWEAEQHRYWRDAYYTARDAWNVLADILRGLGAPFPKFPPLPPYPTRDHQGDDRPPRPAVEAREGDTDHG